MCCVFVERGHGSIELAINVTFADQSTPLVRAQESFSLDAIKKMCGSYAFESGVKRPQVDRYASQIEYFISSRRSFYILFPSGAVISGSSENVLVRVK